MSGEMYEIIFSKKAQNYYDRLPDNLVRKINKVIQEMEVNPWSGDVKGIAGEIGTFRRRIGELRITYQVDIKAMRIYIDRIGPRGDVYKK